MPANERALEIDSEYYNSMSELGYDRTQADSFVSVLQECWSRDGRFGATVGGVTGLVVGGSVTLGSLSIPGWVLGVAVGGVVGELKCANKPVRAMFTHEKAALKSQIDRILTFSFLTEPLKE